MLYFRLTLSKFERKSLFKALSQAQKSGQLTVVNRIRAILAIAEGKDIDDIAAILRVSKEGCVPPFTYPLYRGFFHNVLFCT
jgi:hypothetical protein